VSFYFIFFQKCWHCTSQHSRVWCQVWKLEHTWGAFVQRNKQTWVMLEKTCISWYCLVLFKLVFDTVLYFIHFEYCGIEKRLLSLWQTYFLLFSSLKTTFTAVLAPWKPDLIHRLLHSENGLVQFEFKCYSFTLKMCSFFILYNLQLILLGTHCAWAANVSFSVGSDPDLFVSIG